MSNNSSSYFGHTDSNHIFESLKPIKHDILQFDLISRTCKYLTFGDSLVFTQSSSPSLVLFQIENPKEISLIRKTYNLHPIIENECIPSKFSQTDKIIEFDDYLFMTLTDATISEEIDEPVSMKMIIFKNLVFMFTQKPLYSIEKIFHHELAFTNYPEDTAVPEDDIPRCFWRYQNDSSKKFDLRHQGSTKIEEILFKLFDSIVSRLEVFIKSMEDESKVCFDYSNGVSYKDRSEFI